MNTMTMQPYTAFVGIDWADTKHDVCIQSADSLQSFRIRLRRLMSGRSRYTDDSPDPLLLL